MRREIIPCFARLPGKYLIHIVLPSSIVRSLPGFSRLVHMYVWGIYCVVYLPSGKSFLSCNVFFCYCETKDCPRGNFTITPISLFHLFFRLLPFTQLLLSLFHSSSSSSEEQGRER